VSFEELIRRMRERRPLTAWAALSLLGASVVFAIAAPLWVLATHEPRPTGPDPYGEQDLAVLREDPLMQVASEGVVPQGDHREVISNYICAICDFFPTGILQSYTLTQEPSAALTTVESVARSSGWTVVERGCTTEPRLATLVVEKNFPEFHTSTFFKVRVGEESAGMNSRATITHEHKRIRAGELAPADCLDEKWRDLQPPANPG
jgi:hypothetical protein